MASFNMVVLVGNVTRDPEVRQTANGKTVAKVGLAVNRRWRTEGGEQAEEVTFIDCDLFGKTAELAGQYLRRGNPVLFQGRLRLDKWEDKATGQARQKLAVVVETMQFLGGKREEAGPGAVVESAVEVQDVPF